MSALLLALQSAVTLGATPLSPAQVEAIKTQVVGEISSQVATKAEVSSATSGLATKAEVTAATAALATKAEVSSVAATVPVARTTVPMSEIPAGQAGTPGTYTPGNARAIRLSRTGTCVLTSGGVCSANWDGSAFPAGMIVRKVGDPAPTNAGSQPIQCNFTAISLAGFSVRCWVAQTTIVSLLGVTIAPFVSSTLGVSVDATALSSSES